MTSFNLGTPRGTSCLCTLQLRQSPVRRAREEEEHPAEEHIRIETERGNYLKYYHVKSYPRPTTTDTLTHTHTLYGSFRE
jgi:hypothetical protein